jgi:hypothetical protein
MKAITIRATSAPPALSGELLTAAIRQEHEAASAAAGAALGHALEAGRLLAEARAAISHGAWESYVRESCGIAPRTASLYMRLHRHRDRLPNRQHVADLSMRQAARLLERPRAKAEPVAAAFDYLGPSWATMMPTACEWNREWRLVPWPLYGEAVDVPRPVVPSWYSPGHRHTAEHESGWSFDVRPDPVIPDRVNVIVHDAAGTLHLASFDGMVPDGIVPFLTACERHRQMPAIGEGWTIETAAVPNVIARLGQPFTFEIFGLASRPGHRCECWALIDQAIGATPSSGNPFFTAWEKLGTVLGSLFGKGEPSGHFGDSGMWWLGDLLNYRPKPSQGASA